MVSESIGPGGWSDLVCCETWGARPNSYIWNVSPGMLLVRSDTIGKRRCQNPLSLVMELIRYGVSKEIARQKRQKSYIRNVLHGLLPVKSDMIDKRWGQWQLVQVIEMIEYGVKKQAACQLFYIETSRIVCISAATGLTREGDWVSGAELLRWCGSVYKNRVPVSYCTKKMTRTVWCEWEVAWLTIEAARESLKACLGWLCPGHNNNSELVGEHQKRFAQYVAGEKQHGRQDKRSEAAEQSNWDDWVWCKKMMTNAVHADMAWSSLAEYGGWRRELDMIVQHLQWISR